MKYLYFGDLDAYRLQFGEALRAEGMPNMLGYSGKSIFLYTEASMTKKTCGESGFPFRRPYTDRQDIAGAIARVAPGLGKR